MAHKKLYRSCENRIIAGVCAGIAEYFDIDPVIIRLIFVIIILAGGAGILAYLIAWLIIPENPDCPKVCCAKEEIKKEEKEEPIAHHGSDKNSQTSLVIGLIMAAFGVFFLFNNLFNWDFAKNFWALLLIAVGVIFVVQAQKKESK